MVRIFCLCNILLSPKLICCIFVLSFVFFFPVDSPDRNGASALLFACRALARLPAEKKDHPLFQWALALLRGFMAAGADFHARDNAGACPAVLGVAFDNMQQEQFLENGSLYQSVWPTIRRDMKSSHSSLILAQKTKKKYIANVENTLDESSSPNTVNSPSSSSVFKKSRSHQQKQFSGRGSVV